MPPSLKGGPLAAGTQLSIRWPQFHFLRNGNNHSQRTVFLSVECLHGPPDNVSKVVLDDTSLICN